MASKNIKQKYLEAKRSLFEKHYSFLNEMQRKAVFNVKGPLLVLAGAGSGKTTVLVNRIAYLLRYGNAYHDDEVPAGITEQDIAGIESASSLGREELGVYLERFAKDVPEPWMILAITFTNKAAGEIKNRIVSLFGENSEEALSIKAGTFHSVCAQILRQYIDRIGYDKRFTIIDADDSRKQIQYCIKELDYDEKVYPPRLVQTYISRAKDSLIDCEEYSRQHGKDAKYRHVSRIYELYSEKLKSQNLLDFDDLIMLTVKLLEECDDVLEKLQNRFRFLSVDEFQDTNKAQLRLTLLLSEKYRNVMVVGDDDQSIYKFRGAVVKNILNFNDYYENTAVIRLEQNYRSTSNILNCANGLIANNKGRMGKNLWTSAGEGDKVFIKMVLNQNDEGRFIADTAARGVRDGGSFRDFAVLYRTNAQSRAIEQVLAKSGIPYRIIGGIRFYERAEVKDIIAYLSVINNPDDTLRLKRIINTPRRGIGDKSIKIAEDLAAEEGSPLIELMRRAKRYTAISTSTANQMVNFVYMIDQFRDDLEGYTLSEFIRHVITTIKYDEMIEEIKDSFERQDRRENLDELVSAAAQYEESHEDPTLSSFLEDVALISDIDKYDESADAVVLMTVHSAKGLEFENVILAGMEDGLFPSVHAIDEGNEEIEEERRLAYVAITRAKKRLYITYARERTLNGRNTMGVPSRFIKEIPDECVQTEELSQPRNDFRSFRPRLPKMEPVNYFRNETLKQSPALVSSRPAPKPALESFSEGDTVMHNTFGLGVVVSARPTSGDCLLEIVFEKVGTKKLLATYAKLKKIK
ncbi:MAG: UvrD-helicase domain-containing protein [Clostridia bacterium]|nr:UvrD-helicase domain-containing protein [Clostridia bacterium]